jgi:hypothetical protein
MGCVSRAFEPQRITKSVSSTSRYDEVPPPAPKTVARPATLGACQVRLQLSTLLLPMTTRVNFCAMKFISFVVLEQLNIPKLFGPSARAFSKPAAAAARASSQEASRRRPPSLTRGCVKRSKYPPHSAGSWPEGPEGPSIANTILPTHAAQRTPGPRATPPTHHR